MGLKRERETHAQTPVALHVHSARARPFWGSFVLGQDFFFF